MRHLVGVVLAMAMATAVFFAASWGYLKLLIGSARRSAPPTSPSLFTVGGGSLIHDHAVLEGFGALVAVGLVAGLLIAVPRISPLAPGLPGLVLLAWTGLYLFSARRAVQYIPLKTQAYGTGFEAMLVDGVLAMAGLAMIIPLFVPSRWQGRPVAAGPASLEAAATTYPDLQDTQTVTGGGLLADWAQTRPQPRIDFGRAQAPWGPADPASSAGQGSPADYG
jgi:hypothetical protein